MNDKRETISNVIKLFLLVFTMVQGFFLTFALVWTLVGLPLTTWAFLVLYAFAGAAEYGYYRWIRE